MSIVFNVTDVGLDDGSSVYTSVFHIAPLHKFIISHQLLFLTQTPAPASVVLIKSLQSVLQSPP